MYKKKNVTKLFILLLIAIAFSIFTQNNVNATTTTTANGQIYELNENSDTIKDDKILEYDARTKETREVDMQELRELNSLLRKNTDCTMGYTPKKNNLTPSIIEPRAIFNRVYNVTADPNYITCRVSLNGNEANGSASLVGKNLALTAAHCIFDSNNNFYNWECYPAYARWSI